MLLRHTLRYLPAQLLSPVLQLAAVVAWTHCLAPEAYGVLAYLMAAHEFCIVPAIVWWSGWMMRDAAGRAPGDGGMERLRRTETAVLAFALVVQTLVCLGVLATLGAPAGPGLAAAFVLYGATRTVLFNVGERARAEMDFGAYTVAQFFAPALGLAVGFAGMALAGPGPAAALAGFAVGQGAALAWTGRLGAAIRWTRPERSVVAAALRFGAPMTIAGLVGWASVNGIRIVVERTEGLAAVGLLSVGWTLGQRLASVAAMLVTAAGFPLVLKRLREEGDAAAKENLALNTALLLAALAPVTVGAVLVAPLAIDLLIAEPFRAATVAVLPIAVAAGAVRNARQHGPDQVLLVFERSAALMWLYIGEAVLTLGLALAGAQAGGMVGAAWGCLAGAVVAALVSGAVAVVGFRTPLPLAHAARIGLATLAMALGVRAVAWPAGAPGLAGAVGLGAALYALTLGVLYAPEIRLGWRERRGAVAAAE